MLTTCLAVLQADAHWLEELIRAFCGRFDPWSFLGQEWNVRFLLAIVCVGLACGAVGSLVVGNRMAFFSDALAHCAFAGVSLGFLFYVFTYAGRGSGGQGLFWEWVTPIMVAFGMLVGLGIAWVREKTALASDTVIAVFFAGAVGFAAMLRQLIRSRQLFTLEDFLFGDPVLVQARDIVWLFLLLVVTFGLLLWMYNGFVFTSFNASLARSRHVPVRLCNYLFILLLALIVNLCLKAVGALLINALLIVPAATARNLARNMRQLFWLTVVLCLLVGVGGQALSWEVRIPQPAGRQAVTFGIGGTIVVLSVVLFYLSMLWEAGVRRWGQMRAAREARPVPEEAPAG
ncbi:MAG TPA: metal ABC transporter permease [Gemmataceae bacterium]|nr:metal ABC transporter permease [Gemmataceae bacterium]